MTEFKITPDQQYMMPCAISVETQEMLFTDQSVRKWVKVSPNGICFHFQDGNYLETEMFVAFFTDGKVN